MATTVQESTSPHLSFCQWMGLEMSNLDEELFTGFSCEAFNLVEWISRPISRYLILLLLSLHSFPQCSHSSRLLCASSGVTTYLPAALAG